MFIKTSNGTSIINTNSVFNIYTGDSNEVYASASTDEYSIKLGKYYDSKDAKKVLDDILAAIENNETVYIMPQDYEVQDIEDKKTEDTIITPKDVTIYRFRAKKITDNEWVYGSYDEVHSLITNTEGVYAVNSETVGMSTSLLDSAGNTIFEGDVVEEYTEVSEGDDAPYISSRKGVIAYSVRIGAYIFYDDQMVESLIEPVDEQGINRYYEIIGNAYDS